MMRGVHLCVLLVAAARASGSTAVKLIIDTDIGGGRLLAAFLPSPRAPAWLAKGGRRRRRRTQQQAAGQQCPNISSGTCAPAAPRPQPDSEEKACTQRMTPGR